MRRAALLAGKIFLSGIIAFFILNLFSSFYRNFPGAYVDPDGVTNDRSAANRMYFQGCEGFSWGITNNEGYVNLFDYDEQIPVDVLIMGSSQMEGFQVTMEKSTASRLNALLEDKVVYNVGRSAHDFLTCAGHLEAAVKKYHPSEYVIIETASCTFSDSELADAIASNTPPPYRRTDGIIRRLLKKSDFLILLSIQLVDHQKALEKVASASASSVADTEKMENSASLDKLLEKMALTARDADSELIIAYDPKMQIQPDGTLLFEDSSEAVQQFHSLCEQHGIIFLDMSSRFRREYDERHILPYGFSNTSAGKGHLNQHGHEMIADELYKLIAEE